MAPGAASLLAALPHTAATSQHVGVLIRTLLALHPCFPRKEKLRHTWHIALGRMRGEHVAAADLRRQLNQQAYSRGSALFDAGGSQGGGGNNVEPRYTTPVSTSASAFALTPSVHQQ